VLQVPPEIKLPVLYLIDSIVKNVGKAYINLFTQNIVQCFTNTFEKVSPALLCNGYEIN
jgi:pre-mRNA cleavage complex 2 protein Pcf11